MGRLLELESKQPDGIEHWDYKVTLIMYILGEMQCEVKTGLKRIILQN